MNIRVVRLKGFARGEAKEFSESPVTLGTSPTCSVRFDSGWDKNVAAQHARLERDGSDWLIADAGSAAGTWINGRRVDRPERIDSASEIELGKGGPRMRLETVPAIAAPASPRAARDVSAPAAPLLSPPPARPRRIPRSKNPTLIVASSALGLLLLGGISWWLLSGKPSAEKLISMSPLPPLMERESPTYRRPPAEPAEEPEQPAAEAASAPQRQAQAGKPIAGLASLSEEERAMVAKQKAQPMYRGLRQFWTETNTQSPYTRSFLQNEDAWFAGVMAYLRGVNADSFTVPGLFIGEYFSAGTLLPGTPITPDVLVAQLKPGVMGGTGEGATRTVAAANPRARGFAVSPKALDSLKRQFDAKAKGSGAKPKAWAVLVGINDFEFVNDLTSCRNDVTALAKVLTTQGIFEPAQVRLLTDARRGTPDYASKANVIAALNDTIRSAAENDIIFICISGHGGFDKRRKDSHFYVADSKGVSDGQASQEYEEAVKTVIYGQELDALLSKAKARNILMAFDACHSGGLTALGTRQLQVQPRNLTRVSHQFGIVPESFYERIGEARGHVVIRACRSDQTTPDLAYLGFGQSMLTLVLLQGLTGDADANHDGIVTLGELRIFTTTAIPKISRNAAAAGEDQGDNRGPLEPTFTSGAFGEAGDLPLTVVAQP